jgi:hypothetical protein
MACNCREFEDIAPTATRRVAASLGFILSALMVGILTLGCGGGSSGMQPPPPPPATFTTVDAPGAGTVTPEGTFGVAIDADGDVAGYFTDSNVAFHGFVENANATEFSIDAPGASTQQGDGTLTEGINDSDEIVGYFIDTQGLEHSFLRSANGDITTFDPPSSTSGAQSINDGGTVAGGYVDVNGAHGYLRASGGTFTTFDPTGDPLGVQIVIPYRINTSGAVAGTYIDTGGVYHGFTLAPNGAIAIEDAPGAGTATDEGTDLLDMNSSGEIVGGIAVGDVGGVVGVTHSLILSADGTFTVFDPPQSGAHSSIAKGINDSGEIVGEYRDANLVRHGYLRAPGGTFTSFDDPNAAQMPLSDQFIGTTPRGINASGAVVGTYSDTNGVRHAFVMQ